MKTLLIFLAVYIAMIAMSFWESSVEGRNAGNRKKHGWRIKFLGRTITRYHFFLFVVMFPALLSLPLIVSGWSTKLFGILLTAYLSGMVIEDFVWFLVNPVVKFSEWGPKLVNYYSWIKIGKVNIPVFYIINLLLCVIIWYFLWR